jgi:hypothetical protein
MTNAPTTTWHDAFALAWPQWEAVIRHAGWHPYLVAAGYAAAALACAACGQADRRAGGSGIAWYAAAGVLALIGANAVLRLDLLAIYALRAAAAAQGWYGARREWQVATFAALAVAALPVLFRLRRRLASAWFRGAPAVLGVALLVAVAAARAVSLHFTDQILDQHVAGISAGRWLELAGLALTAAGAAHWSFAA